MAGLRKNLTVKGGVVMSGITDLIRRATMDTDVDFLHYSISKASVRQKKSTIPFPFICRFAVGSGRRPYHAAEDEKVSGTHPSLILY